MKKLVFILVSLTLFTSSIFSQKFGFFESEKILEKMPAFQQANTEIEIQMETWKSEIDSKFDKVDQLYDTYVANEQNLSENARQLKQQEIIDAEQEANEFKQEIFGPEGEAQKLQSEKIDPLLEKINEAVKTIAKEQSYDFIFEKSADSQWVVINENYNITSFVINFLGLE